jgi:hypothetical protein
MAVRKNDNGDLTLKKVNSSTIKMKIVMSEQSDELLTLGARLILACRIVEC